jgi:SAM-dependent methyltransferase
MFTQTARFYDALYAGKGKNYQRESDRLKGFIESHAKTPAAALLDVACGTGGHLQFLRQWYEVEGLDLDEAMLAIARERLPEVPLHQGDMREFELGRTFDVVVSLFSSIGYMRDEAELRQAIANLARHTNPGGLVIVEPWLTPGQILQGRAHAIFFDEPDLKIARLNVNQVEERKSNVVFHYLIAEGVDIRYLTETHETYLFTKDEYLAAFRAAGLAVHHDQEGLYGRGLYIGSKSLL